MFSRSAPPSAPVAAPAPAPFQFMVRGDPAAPAAPAPAAAPAAPAPAAAPAALAPFQFMVRGSPAAAPAAPAAALSVGPTASIPLPFVKSGTDLGNTPVQSAILEEFKKTSAVDFNNVSKEIDDYIYGNDFATVTAGMTPDQIEEYRVGCWYRFQDTLLVPAMNRMMSASGSPAMIQLSPMARSYTQAVAEAEAAAALQGVYDKFKLSHLEYFATNLYTKESVTPGTTQQFYRVLNRVLLQPVQNAGTEMLINSQPYDDDKKIFNVWFFLFLSGLQKLLVSVPAMFKDPTNQQRSSVRLYRGMGVGEKLSQSLWKPPVLQEVSKTAQNLTDRLKSLFTTKRDVVADVPVNTINEYKTRAFSSFSLDINVSCGFALNRDPTIFVYEPARGRVEMPDLSSVSDLSKEKEYLMFPESSMVIIKREVATNFSGYNESCGPLNQANKKITWLGLMDAVQGNYDIEGIDISHTSSGGRRKKRSINHVHKHKCLTRRRRRGRCNNNKTHKYRGRKYKK
jgi:hypothetical protein